MAIISDIFTLLKAISFFRPTHTNRFMRKLRSLLIFWTLFIGIGALWGSAMMFIDPGGTQFGLDEVLEQMHVLPLSEVLFKNLIFPGILLLLINGITQLFTAWLLFRRKKNAALFGMACGILLMLWIVVQFVTFGFNPLSNIYFVIGLLETINGFWLWRLSRNP